MTDDADRKAWADAARAWREEHPLGRESEPPLINVRAPYDIARIFAPSEPETLHFHRGGFYEWSGRAWPDADESMLRSRLYEFLDRCTTTNAKGEVIPVKPTAPMVGNVLDGLRAAKL